MKQPPIRVDIIEGPSLEDVVKSLTTVVPSKHPLAFKLAHDYHREVKACCFTLRDSGTFDTNAQSEMFELELTWYPLNNYARATAFYFPRTKKWGKWTFVEEY